MDGRARGLFRTLENHRATRCQRGSELASIEDRGIVPRREGGDDTDCLRHDHPACAHRNCGRQRFGMRTVPFERFDGARIFTRGLRYRLALFADSAWAAAPIFFSRIRAAETRSAPRSLAGLDDQASRLCSAEAKASSRSAPTPRQPFQNLLGRRIDQRQIGPIAAGPPRAIDEEVVARAAGHPLRSQPFVASFIALKRGRSNTEYCRFPSGFQIDLTGGKSSRQELNGKFAPNPEPWQAIARHRSVS